MSDEQMDARLRSAGERWRTATAVVEQTGDEPLELIPPTPSRPRRALALVSAAVVVIALAIGAVLFAVNRGSDSSPAAVDPTQALQGVTWTDAQSGATLVFLSGAVRVFDGCSGGQRALVAHDHVIRLGKPIGTQSACSEIPPIRPAYDRAAHRFYRVVERGAFTWSLSGVTLRAVANGLTVTLVSDRTHPPRIVDQTWVLEQFNDSNGYTHVAPAGVKLTFAGAHRFTTSDTCNTLSGTVRSTLTVVTFRAVRTSLVGCLRTLPVQPVVDALLHGTTHYEIQGTELILHRPHYPGSLVYRAK